MCAFRCKRERGEEEAGGVAHKSEDVVATPSWVESAKCKHFISSSVGVPATPKPNSTIQPSNNLNYNKQCSPVEALLEVLAHAPNK